MSTTYIITEDNKFLLAENDVYLITEQSDEPVDEEDMVFVGTIFGNRIIGDPHVGGF